MVLVRKLKDDGLQAAAGATAGGGVEHNQRPVAGVVQVPQSYLAPVHPQTKQSKSVCIPSH